MRFQPGLWWYCFKKTLRLLRSIFIPANFGLAGAFLAQLYEGAFRTMWREAAMVVGSMNLFILALVTIFASVEYTKMHRMLSRFSKEVRRIMSQHTATLGRDSPKEPPRLA